MTTIEQFKPHGYKTISNDRGIEIMINETSEQVSYKYTDEDEVQVSSVSYDQEGDPYFMEYRGPYNPRTYYLNEFMKIK